MYCILQVRDKLEKAIACFIATNKRPLIRVKTGNIRVFDEMNAMEIIRDENQGFLACLQKFFAPERFGFEEVGGREGVSVCAPNKGEDDV